MPTYRREKRISRHGRVYVYDYEITERNLGLIRIESPFGVHLAGKSLGVEVEEISSILEKHRGNGHELPQTKPQPDRVKKVAQKGRIPRRVAHQGVRARYLPSDPSRDTPFFLEET